MQAPIPDPGKIICIGLNYRDHAAESNSPLPPYPIVFAKYANTVLAPGEAIVLPKNSQQIDYEAEFGVVIGKRARHVSEADALNYVGGYLPFHDVSASTIRCAPANGRWAKPSIPLRPWSGTDHRR